MVKGRSRIWLDTKKDTLVKCLKEYMALSDMAVFLEREGVRVSVSSLYRYMITDLPEEYREYLWHTGRGLLISRRSQAGERGESKPKAPMSRESNSSKISNPKDFNKFISKNR